MNEGRIETGADVVTVIAEPGALTFATRKEWERIQEGNLEEVYSYATEKIFKGTYSVFFLLRNLAPLDQYVNIRFKLLKVSIDEDGKQVFFVMNLSAAEASQLCKNRLNLWD